MRVKGVAYLSRLQLLRAKLGDEALEVFLEDYRSKHPEFPRDVLPTTRIPARDFLHFMDAVVDSAYGGDAESLWEVGERSAEWSLREGPYRNLFEGRDIDRFATLAPVLYQNFFDTGEARSERQGDVVDLWITGIPPTSATCTSSTRLSATSAAASSCSGRMWICSGSRATRPATRTSTTVWY